MELRTVLDTQPRDDQIRAHKETNKLWKNCDQVYKYSLLENLFIGKKIGRDWTILHTAGLLHGPRNVDPLGP